MRDAQCAGGAHPDGDRFNLPRGLAANALLIEVMDDRHDLSVLASASLAAVPCSFQSMHSEVAPFSAVVVAWHQYVVQPPLLVLRRGR